MNMMTGMFENTIASFKDVLEKTTSMNDTEITRLTDQINSMRTGTTASTAREAGDAGDAGGDPGPGGPSAETRKERFDRLKAEFYEGMGLPSNVVTKGLFLEVIADSVKNIRFSFATFTFSNPTGTGERLPPAGWNTSASCSTKVTLSSFTNKLLFLKFFAIG